MNAETTPRKSLSWFEPRWSYVPGLKKEFHQIIKIKVWLRIAAVSILLTVLIAYGVKRAVPDLEFDWAGRFALCIGGLFFGLLCMFGLWWLVPPFIRINAKGVARQEGQHVSWWRRADIRRITLDTTDPARPRLNIEAAGKRPFEGGIADKVGVKALAVFLRATFPELTVEEKGCG